MELSTLEKLLEANFNINFSSKTSSTATRGLIDIRSQRQQQPERERERMAQGGSKQPNTAYGMFLQACWAQHKRQYPETLINKEIEEFNKQCSVWDVLIISLLKFEI